MYLCVLDKKLNTNFAVIKTLDLLLEEEAFNKYFSKKHSSSAFTESNLF